MFPTSGNNTNYVGNRLDDFYSSSTIFTPNKFIVNIGGDYIEKAIQIMQLDSDKTSNSTKAYMEKIYEFAEKNKKTKVVTTLTQPLSPYKDSLNDWLDNFVIDKNTINLRWTCQNITLPILRPSIVTAGTTNGIKVDPIKNIQSSYVNTYSGDDSISMSIVEQEGMIFFHFLNILTNLMIDVDTLTSTDTIGKLWVKVWLYEQPMFTPEEQNLTYTFTRFTKTPLFEYNSVIYEGIGALAFSFNSADKLTYTVNFKTINPFQKPFKDTATGMANRISDIGALNYTNGQKQLKNKFGSVYNITRFCAKAGSLVRRDNNP